MQANWAPGKNVGRSLCWGEQRSIEQHSVSDDPWEPLDIWSILSQTGPDAPEFSKAKNWQAIDIKLDWLNGVTPALSTNETGYTTLAWMLERGQPNIEEEVSVVQKTDLFISIGAMVASVVADGLSRIGYDKNYADEMSRLAQIGYTCLQNDSLCP